LPPGGTTSAVAGPADIEAQQYRKWTGNARTFRRYRFVLAMENEAVRGNITARSIPIYYGIKEIFEVFNARAFVFYNVVSDPRMTLETIAHLEMNRTAYLAMLSEPILASGDETMLPGTFRRTTTIQVRAD
jgi:hypothetical protein